MTVSEFLSVLASMDNPAMSEIGEGLVAQLSEARADNVEASRYACEQSNRLGALENQMRPILEHMGRYYNLWLKDVKSDYENDTQEGAFSDMMDAYESYLRSRIPLPEGDKK